MLPWVARTHMKNLTRTLPFGQLYGDVLRSRVVADFTLTETVYPPNLELPRHSHEGAYFCLVMQGAYTESYGKQTRLCRPTALIFHPPAEVHSDRFHRTGGRCLNIQMGPGWLRRVAEPSLNLDRAFHVQAGELSHLAVRLSREFRSADEASTLAIEGLILEILAEAARNLVLGSCRRPPTWLEPVREALHSRFSERQTLTDLAELAGVHPVHLAREFRKNFGCTIGEYVRHLRIEFACRQLSAPAMSLVEIAGAAGFSHQAHFTRIFKQIVGISPGRYRAAARLR